MGFISGLNEAVKIESRKVTKITAAGMNTKVIVTGFKWRTHGNKDYN